MKIVSSPTFQETELRLTGDPDGHDQRSSSSSRPGRLAECCSASLEEHPAHTPLEAPAPRPSAHIDVALGKDVDPGACFEQVDAFVDRRLEHATPPVRAKDLPGAEEVAKEAARGTRQGSPIQKGIYERRYSRVRKHDVPCTECPAGQCGILDRLGWHTPKQRRIIHSARIISCHPAIWKRLLCSLQLTH